MFLTHVSMVGIDHKTADVAAREHFSLTASRWRPVLEAVCRQPGVEGCAIIATCNRVELYLSHSADVLPDGVSLFSAALGLDPERHRRYFVERREGEAVRHLMRVAGGMESRVLGDDQIITQVREAAETAREANACDALLETLFRCAVTAGKRIKTEVTFARAGGSVAAEAVRAAAARLGGLAGKQALVIGNGVIGRLTAAALVDKGCGVAVTLRTCGHGGPAIPDGCEAVAYDERYCAMAGRDLVVSATASPHHTVAFAEFRALEDPPDLVIDLALPRDVEPEVGSVPGVTLWNVDHFRRDGNGDDGRRFFAAEDIVEAEFSRFTAWRRNRETRRREREGAPDFPVFINLHGARVLVAGGGKVAARRAGTLLEFGARVRVVSPEASPELRRLFGRDGLSWEQRKVEPDDLDGVVLAVAATDDREANRNLGREAKERGILVSVADRREECSFYFPAVIRSGCLTAGLASTNGSHALVAGAAALIRENLAEFVADNQGREQG